LAFFILHSYMFGLTEARRVGDPACKRDIGF
jgi:hypothetical protein